jgi:hypothetical protein
MPIPMDPLAIDHECCTLDFVFHDAGQQIVTRIPAEILLYIHPNHVCLEWIGQLHLFQKLQFGYGRAEITKDHPLSPCIRERTVYSNGLMQGLSKHGTLLKGKFKARMRVTDSAVEIMLDASRKFNHCFIRFEVNL